MKKLLLIAAMLLLLTGQVHTQQTWERNYGGMGDDEGKSVQQTVDGGYIIAGTYDWFGTNSQVYLIKINASGDTLWTRDYGGPDVDWGSSVQQTQDGGYIIAAQEGGMPDFSHVYLIRTNTSGDTLWTRDYGWNGSDTVQAVGHCVRQTSDGGFIVTGGVEIYPNPLQVYLVRTNASGDTLWTRNFGDTLNKEVGYSVQQTTDGGFIVAGVYDWLGSNSQIYLIKTNASGDTIWTKTYNGGVDYFGNTCVQQTSDGGYVVVGNTSSFGNGSQVYLIKTDPSGDTIWTRNYGGAGDEGGCSVQQTQDGGYIIAGTTTSFGNGSQVYVIKTDSLGLGIHEEKEQRQVNLDVRFTCHPNPFTTITNVNFLGRNKNIAANLTIYDISGRMVKSVKLETSSYQLGTDLVPGIYFLKLNGKSVGKVVKVR